jgi:hypothetical protein
MKVLGKPGYNGLRANWIEVSMSLEKGTNKM